MKKVEAYQHLFPASDVLAKKTKQDPYFKKLSVELDYFFNRMDESTKEILIKSFPPPAKKLTKNEWAAHEVCYFEALDPSPEWKQFCDKARELETKYNMKTFLGYKDGKLLYFPVIMLDYSLDGTEVCENCRGITLLVNTPEIAGRKTAIPVRTIQETPQGDIIFKSLSEKLHKFLPTIVFYQPQDSEGMMLLSIPRNSNFTEINKHFAKEITNLHSSFFKTPKGRPRSKEAYKQDIFNREFTTIRSSRTSNNKVTDKKDFEEVAELFKKKYSIEISWKTLKKDYYPKWEAEKWEKGLILFPPNYLISL